MADVSFNENKNDMGTFAVTDSARIEGESVSRSVVSESAVIGSTFDTSVGQSIASHSSDLTTSDNSEPPDQDLQEELERAQEELERAIKMKLRRRNRKRAMQAEHEDKKMPPKKRRDDDEDHEDGNEKDATVLHPPNK